MLSTNFSYVWQSCLNAINNSGTYSAGSFFFKKGYYPAQYDVSYAGIESLIIQGEGNRYSEYGGLTTDIMGTFIYFIECDFIGNEGENWNTAGWHYFKANDVCFGFSGNSGTDKGYWKSNTTFPAFDRVSLIIRGSYDDDVYVLFGRGNSAVGRTVPWLDVTVDVRCSGKVTGCYMNFDCFQWIGGSIRTGGSVGVNSTMVSLESTMGMTVSDLSTFRDGGSHPAINWFALTPSNAPNQPYVFSGVTFYGWDNATDVTYHFWYDHAETTLIDVEHCTCPGDVWKTEQMGALKSTNYFSGVANGSYVSVTERGIPLAGTPQIVVPSAYNATVWYNNVNSTHVQIYGNNATLTGSVYCEYKP